MPPKKGDLPANIAPSIMNMAEQIRKEYKNGIYFGINTKYLLVTIAFGSEWEKKFCLFYSADNECWILLNSKDNDDYYVVDIFNINDILRNIIIADGQDLDYFKYKSYFSSTFSLFADYGKMDVMFMNKK